jgi:Xaa-Pro aminopeptidase
MDPIDLFLIRGPQGVPTHSQYLRDQLPSGSQVGYDPSLHSAQAIQTLTSFISQKKITLVPGQNLIDLLWGPERPSLPFSDQTVRLHSLEFAGLNPTEKFQILQKQYLKTGADADVGVGVGQQRVLITASLDEIAWLHNIRGDDVKCNPILLAYSIIREGG